MVWKPAKALGVAAGLTMAITVVGIGIFLVGRIVEPGLSLNWYFTVLLLGLSLVLLALWAYWYYGLLTLRNHLDRNSLTIASGGISYRVPMDAILSIVPGNQVAASQGFHGIAWPGYLRGRMRLEGLGTLLVRSTEPLARQLVVITDSLCYGISPRDAKRFMEDYALRRALGSIREVEQTVEYAPLLALPIWRDSWFWGITLASFLATAALLGFLADVYGGLPERVPVHFGPGGQADRIAAKSSLLALPAIGVVALAVNSLLGVLLHRHERLATYLLVGMAVSVQAILWLAATSILGR